MCIPNAVCLCTAIFIYENENPSLDECQTNRETICYVARNALLNRVKHLSNRWYLMTLGFAFNNTYPNQSFTFFFFGEGKGEINGEKFRWFVYQKEILE